ncbi:MAG: hypothetical protein WAM52_13220 [Steroidobacteraceae bacterium]
MSVMYVATLDILTEKGGFNPQAARAIGDAIDLEIARSRDASVTKADLSDCRRILSEEIGALRADTDRNISALRAELSAVHAELKDNISGLHAELKDNISGLRTELKDNITGLRTELKGELGALRTELKVDGQSIKADLVRWVFVAITGQSAMLLGVLYLFVKYFK